MLLRAGAGPKSTKGRPEVLFYYTDFFPSVKCSNIIDDIFLREEYNTPITTKALEESSLEKAERRH